MDIKLENQELSVTRPNDSLRNRSLHGTTRALLNNMVIGVTNGYEKILDIKGNAESDLLRPYNFHYPWDIEFLLFLGTFQ